MKDEAAWGKWEESREWLKPNTFRDSQIWVVPRRTSFLSHADQGSNFAPSLSSITTPEHLYNCSDNQFHISLVVKLRQKQNFKQGEHQELPLRQLQCWE